MEQKMITVVVLCYRNFIFLKDAIKSVLNQKYDNIELIISDDGSDNFPRKEIDTYIKNNKKTNIKNYIINCEKVNLGTVKHLNHTILISHGQYICFLAADDMFYDEHVIEHYIEGIENAKDCSIFMAQTAMYDNNMSNILCYYAQPIVQKALKARDYSKLLELLSISPCLPSTSTCFKRDFFTKHGLFDEGYFLVEDYPLHIRIAKEKIPIDYNNFIAIKHRSGGISHDAVGALSKTKIKYQSDAIKCHKTLNEILINSKIVNYKMLKNKNNAKALFCEYNLYQGRHLSMTYLGFIIRHPLLLLRKIFISFSDNFKMWGKKSFILAILIFAFIPDICDAFPLYLQRYMEKGLSCTALILFVFGILTGISTLISKIIRYFVDPISDADIFYTA